MLTIEPYFLFHIIFTIKLELDVYVALRRPLARSSRCAMLLYARDQSKMIDRFSDQRLLP